MEAKLVLLPGDGIGPEIVDQAERVLRTIAQRCGHDFAFESYAVGGNAIDEFGTPLPEETLEACKASHAILLGAVGGPKWTDPNAKTRPEAGLLGLRKELQLFANLRPVTVRPQLLDASPLKREIVDGVDILFVRELTGGIYFGNSGRRELPDGEEAFNDEQTISQEEEVHEEPTFSVTNEETTSPKIAEVARCRVRKAQSRTRSGAPGQHQRSLGRASARR